MTIWVGWDVGGAHVKSVQINASSKQVVSVQQLACPLWKGLDYLKQTLNQLRPESNQDVVHLVTMTGELVDLFESRSHGIQSIINTLTEQLAPDLVYIFAAKYGYLKLDQIQRIHEKWIASTNWMASVMWLAENQSNGLFVDIGSTTTDVLLFAGHRLQAEGVTDFERLQSDELVYTGIIRTAVMAVAQTAYFKGRKTGLMAEYFATMADVYRLTGELNESHDLAETADGAEKSIEASARRLSRMTGYEFNANEMDLWHGFAKQLRSMQKQQIKQACIRQLSRQLLSDDAPFVGAGVGRFLVKDIARELGHPYQDFNMQLTNLNNSIMDAADCAPALAVALLFADYSN